jgi:transposase
MWTEITRPQYLRKGLRYASDVTEAEWSVIHPHWPAAKSLGRPRTVELMSAVNALFSNRQNRLSVAVVAARVSHYSTVQRDFYGWRDDGTLERINFELLVQARGSGS